MSNVINLNPPEINLTAVQDSNGIFRIRMDIKKSGNEMFILWDIVEALKIANALNNGVINIMEKVNEQNTK